MSEIKKSLFITLLQSKAGSSGLETLGSIQCRRGREKSPSFSRYWSNAAQNNILQILSMATYRGARNLSSLSFSLFHHISAPRIKSLNIKVRKRHFNKYNKVLSFRKENAFF